MALAGCATGKRNVQDFIGCLRVGMPLEQMEEACVPRLEKPAVYVRHPSKLFYEEVRISCAQTTVACEPGNLPQLLHLDYSPPATKAFIDAMSITGALIAGIAYPQGVHTGSGAPLWGVWVMLANLAVYIAFWYICLRLVRYFRRKYQQGLSRVKYQL